MKRTGLLILFGLLIAAPAIIHGQKHLIVEKIGRFRHFTYKKSDRIILRTRLNDVLIDGEITEIRDTILIIDEDWEVNFSEISEVYKVRKFYPWLSFVLVQAGLAYFTVSSINRAINHEYPVVDGHTAAVSGGILLGAVAAYALKIKKIRLDKGKWKLKVLDYDQLK